MISSTDYTLKQQQNVSFTKPQAQHQHTAQMPRLPG